MKKSRFTVVAYDETGMMDIGTVDNITDVQFYEDTMKLVKMFFGDKEFKKIPYNNDIGYHLVHDDGKLFIEFRKHSTSYTYLVRLILQNGVMESVWVNLNRMNARDARKIGLVKGNELFNGVITADFAEYMWKKDYR